MFVAPSAVVVGDVSIGPESSVWFGAIIRGDTAAIRIGQQTNIQDLCVLHVDEGFPCEIGDRVTLGHGAIVHGATVGDDVLIGIRAVVLNGCRIGPGSLIAAGAVVPEGTEVPPNSVVMGMPAKMRRTTSEEDLQRIQHAAQHYVALAHQYAQQGE